MATETLLTIKQVEVIGKKKFIVAALDTDNKTLIIYITTPVKLTIIPIYLFCEI